MPNAKSRIGSRGTRPSGRGAHIRGGGLGHCPAAAAQTREAYARRAVRGGHESLARALLRRADELRYAARQLPRHVLRGDLGLPLAGGIPVSRRSLAYRPAVRALFELAEALPRAGRIDFALAPHGGGDARRPGRGDHAHGAV